MLLGRLEAKTCFEYILGLFEIEFVVLTHLAFWVLKCFFQPRLNFLVRYELQTYN